MTNRLAAEASPYLRQHAGNPVDWYPWGDEAFARARDEDRPVLLSVGYSSCHWCHVMAHESFEDEATAELMNRYFVNVKLDREERPDVDAIYMSAVQALTGHGGWPMTVWLTPDARPFFAGTYFPKAARAGQPSFVQIIESVHDIWVNRRDDVNDQAARLTDTIARESQLVPQRAPAPDSLAPAIANLSDSYDAAWGGFGSAPKFPQAMTLDAALRSWLHSHDPDVLHMVMNTLDAMAAGGIYDHLGGGFARYSTDGQWIVPHFEKMLYDNALLARVYLHAWQATGKHRYLQVVREVFDYCCRDLFHPDGGFYSAEDADSEGHEGTFYVFSLDEIRQALVAGGLDDAEISTVVRWYGASEQGNFTSAELAGARRNAQGKNILFRPRRGQLARPPLIERGRTLLLDFRNRRVRPGLDDKVLTEWNGLLLSALAEAAAATGDEGWHRQAVRTADFLLSSLRRADGRWLRSWQDGAAARHLGYAADYAAMVDALTRVYELTGRARYLTAALETADGLLDLFWDHANGGLFTTGTDAEALITRPKEIMDNATPAASSMAATALYRLAALTGKETYREAADACLRLVGELATRHPTAFGQYLCALDLAAGIDEIVIAGDRPDLVAVTRETWRPTAVIAWGERFDSPLWADRADGAAYVCRNFTCQLPATDADELRRQLQR